MLSFDACQCACYTYARVIGVKGYAVVSVIIACTIYNTSDVIGCHTSHMPN